MANTPLNSLTFPGLSDTYTIKSIPSGGTSGQVLKKASGTDYDVEWGAAGSSVSPYTSTPAALGTASAGSSANYSRGDHVHAMPTAANVGAIAAPSSPASGQVLKYSGSAWAGASLSASDVGAAPAVAEVTISTAGAVTQALDAGKIYHFTGAVTSLSLTLNAPASGQLAQYHFDFESGSTAATVTITGVSWAGGSFVPEASKRYECDILNGYGVYMSW